MLVVVAPLAVAQVLVAIAQVLVVGVQVRVALVVVLLVVADPPDLGRRNKIMKSLKQYLSGGEINAINQTIQAAEQLTDSEVVVVVKSRSGRYDRAEDMVGLILATVIFVTVWIMWQSISLDASWNGEWAFHVSALNIILIFWFGIILGAVIATHFPYLCLPFIAKQQIREEVEQAAQEAFYRYRLRSVSGDKSMLIFVSLYEHRVRILVGDEINKKVLESDWDSLCDELVTAIKNNEMAVGIESIVKRCSHILQQHFPKTAGDTNQLADTLHIIN